MHSRFKHILELDDNFREILRDVQFVTKQPKNLQSILCSPKVRPAPDQVVEEVENPGTFKRG